MDYSTGGSGSSSSSSKKKNKVERKASHININISNSNSNMGVDVGDDEVPHVLAVDDNLVDRKLVERLLKCSSCQVTTAESGMKALDYLGLGDANTDSSGSQLVSRKVNMIITDYCMPGMTGYDLLKKIKESSVLKEVPVVIMSSENIPTRINECMEEGAEMFMLKPLKQSDVKKLTSEVLVNLRA